MTHRRAIEEKALKKLYKDDKKSSAEIAKILGCSEHKVNYWLEKHIIPKRSISEAVYVRKNPLGDPFSFIQPKNLAEAKLFGLGVGLYWGEGNKANKNIVKLGNSDPGLIKSFIKFLKKFFNIDTRSLKFHLHLFSDINPEQATLYWMNEIGAQRSQFYKPTITKTGKLGTYRKKSVHGVLTLYFANTKLRNIMVGHN
ncbi:MAG: hypothetical protein A3B25_00060 [Candidatus Ryanbacteria bacterium RIFCSPLOWO2_01_FULL_48_26]|uniref:Homing endonuclease LAGLIDADG domain-containing protein n=1 Tax=Candidatus Ryanbacteria bacterium RIFCSPLOWO2_01_FULL_48_26 TaxID=1802126 RepID=A0A1G2GV26_9BACT|nr:MAG: hypothetical protein A3B25_00060 [Candidatus Ryanbacteria bacterium RIFCSPLOWO2_01_FULL_48_26]